jgi:hypothetical protein
MKAVRVRKAKLTSGERKLIAIFREIDRGREPIEESEELTRIIQAEIRKYRAEKRRQKQPPLSRFKTN